MNSGGIKCYPSDENTDINKLWIEFGTRRYFLALLSDFF